MAILKYFFQKTSNRYNPSFIFSFADKFMRRTVGWLFLLMALDVLAAVFPTAGIFICSLLVVFNSELLSL